QGFHVHQAADADPADLDPLGAVVGQKLGKVRDLGDLNALGGIVRAHNGRRARLGDPLRQLVRLDTRIGAGGMKRWGGTQPDCLGSTDGMTRLHDALQRLQPLPGGGNYDPGRGIPVITGPARLRLSVRMLPTRKQTNALALAPTVKKGASLEDCDATTMVRMRRTRDTTAPRTQRQKGQTTAPPRHQKKAAMTK